MEVEDGPVGERHLGEIATGGVHDALGDGRGARGVQDEQQVLGVHVLGGAVVGRRPSGGRVLTAQQLVPPVVAAVGHGRRGAFVDGAGPAGHHHVVDARRLRHGHIDVALEGCGRPASEPSVGSDHHPGLGVEDPVPQRVGREASEHHRVDRADAGAGQHGHHQLGDHRHVDGHPVAPADPEAAQHVGEAADVGEQPAVGDGPGVPRLALPVDGHPVPPAGGHMAVEAVVRDVQGAPVEPPGERQLPLQHGVPGTEPVEGAGLLGPEPGPVRFGPPVEARVPQHRPPAELLGGREGAVLGEVVLDGGRGARGVSPVAFCAVVCHHSPASVSPGCCRPGGLPGHDPSDQGGRPRRRASAYRWWASTMEGP